MPNQQPQKTKRSLKTGEKALLGASSTAIISLLIIGFVRNAQPQYGAQMATPEIAGKSIVEAMLGQNEAQIKNLSTTQGYAALQKAIKTTPFNSYPSLGNRILTEWGNSIYWENFADSTGQNDWGLSKDVKPSEVAPRLSFTRTSEGWKLNDYVPQPNRLLKNRLTQGKAWNFKE